MHTRRNALFALGAVAVVLLAGCGGGSGSSLSNADSPFAGLYSGTFTTGSEQEGTTNLTVDTAGNITGTIANTTISQNGTVSGKISPSGTVTAVFAYPGLNASADVTGPLTLSGSPPAQTLTGTLTQSINGTAVDTITVTVAQYVQTN